MAFYLSSTQLTREQREGRLLILSALLRDGVPAEKKVLTNSLAGAPPYVRLGVTAGTCYQSLQLQQASYLASPDAGVSSWRQAITLLHKLEGQLPAHMRQYALWLRSELAIRLELAEAATRQKKEKEALTARIDKLQQKIEALTSIEQSLTEKKETQKSY